MLLAYSSSRISCSFLSSSRDGRRRGRLSIGRPKFRLVAAEDHGSLNSGLFLGVFLRGLDALFLAAFSVCFFSALFTATALLIGGKPAPSDCPPSPPFLLYSN